MSLAGLNSLWFRAVTGSGGGRRERAAGNRRRLSVFLLLLALVVVVGSGRNAWAAAAAPAGVQEQPQDELDDEFDDEYADEVVIADPLEGFNRVMFTFNDRLYFWILKPVARGYRFLVPEPIRVGVRNFFTNLMFPVRFVNCLLQGKLGASGEELSRFLLNSTVGLAGLMDPASYDRMPSHDEDFGQTLGVYGFGTGWYLVWPFLGPSSLRGTAGIVGDHFLKPTTWVFAGEPEEALAVYAGEKVNATSLRLGDYESLIAAVLDPYVAVRNAYCQQRRKLVEK